MEDINENVELIVAIAIVIILQVVSFFKTRMKILELGSLFDEVEKLSLKETTLTPSVLRSKSSLHKFLEKIPNRHVKSENDEDEGIDYTDLSLLAMSGDSRGNGRFRIIVDRTNEYLCKNTGTSADLWILEDICDNQINVLEDEIHNSLNVPLYLGLAGTFIGIITGLWGIDFNHMFGNSNNMAELQQLLHGVVVAMCASLLGLGFTVYNSAVKYKNAVSKTSEGKEEYMDFLRRELMPQLSNSMASSLNSLRGVLGHFVDKFGKNLDAYASSAELLNDNLEKQHLVLAEINELGMSKMANKITESFKQLKDSSESLSVFQTYQKNLNTTISNMTSAVSQIQTLVSKFDEFSAGLALLVSSQNKTNELQQEFKEAITTHFPIGSDAREAWQKEYDWLFKEGKQVSDGLQIQLKESTEYVKNFVNSNNEFFSSFDNLRDLLTTMSDYTRIQAECYKDLKSEISNLRTDYIGSQKETIDLHQTMLKAVKEMTNSIKEKQM